MSCQGMKSIAERAIRDWVEVEKDLVAQRARLIAERAITDWADAEKDLVAQRARLIGNLSFVTLGEVRDVEYALRVYTKTASRAEVRDRDIEYALHVYTRAASKAIESTGAWLAAREIHR